MGLLRKRAVVHFDLARVRDDVHLMPPANGRDVETAGCQGRIGETRVKGGQFFFHVVECTANLEDRVVPKVWARGMGRAPTGTDPKPKCPLMAVDHLQVGRLAGNPEVGAYPALRKEIGLHEELDPVVPALLTHEARKPEVCLGGQALSLDKKSQRLEHRRHRPLRVAGPASPDPPVAQIP